MQMILLGHEGGTNRTAVTGHCRPVGCRSPHISPETSRTVLPSMIPPGEFRYASAGVWPEFFEANSSGWIRQSFIGCSEPPRAQPCGEVPSVGAPPGPACHTPRLPRRRFHTPRLPQSEPGTACAAPGTDLGNKTLVDRR